MKRADLERVIRASADIADDDEIVIVAQAAVDDARREAAQRRIEPCAKTG